MIEGPFPQGCLARPPGTSSRRTGGSALTLRANVAGNGRPCPTPGPQPHDSARTRLHARIVRPARRLIQQRPLFLLQPPLDSLSVRHDRNSCAKSGSRAGGPPGSVTMAPKTTAGEVQHDEPHHDHTDDGEEDLESYGEAVGGRLVVRTGKRGRGGHGRSS